MKEILDKHFPPNFKPVWATNHLEEVTKWVDLGKNFNTTQFELYKEYVGGRAENSCAQPCKATDVTTIFLDETYKLSNNSRLDIVFSKKVTIALSSFPSFNLAMLLSEIGGSMGIWLGLGAVQIIQCLVKFLRRIVLREIII